MVSEPRSRAHTGSENAPHAGPETENDDIRHARPQGAPETGHYDAADLHFTASGDPSAPPVLLLHGWGSSAENMAAIAGELESDYRVVNVDLPGHGFSPAPAEPLGVPEHAALLAELIEARVGGPATVIGHSNGGRIALYMASNPTFRDLIARMVLISPSGITPERSAGYYVRRTIARALKAPFTLLPDRLKEFGLDWLRHSLVWRMLGSSDYRALDGPMRETFVKTVTHHVDEAVRTIEAPTLLVWGDRDTSVSRGQMQFLEENIPDAGLVVLEGAGHYGYLDDFSTFIAATRHFLSAS